MNSKGGALQSSYNFAFDFDDNEQQLHALHTQQHQLQIQMQMRDELQLKQQQAARLRHLQQQQAHDPMMTPVQGALNAAYRHVLEECAALEDAMVTLEEETSKHSPSQAPLFLGDLTSLASPPPPLPRKDGESFEPMLGVSLVSGRQLSSLQPISDRGGVSRTGMSPLRASSPGLTSRLMDADSRTASMLAQLRDQSDALRAQLGAAGHLPPPPPPQLPPQLSPHQPH